jgi:hypothetical protein
VLEAVRGRLEKRVALSSVTAWTAAGRSLLRLAAAFVQDDIDGDEVLMGCNGLVPDNAASSVPSGSVELWSCHILRRGRRIGN